MKTSPLKFEFHLTVILLVFLTASNCFSQDSLNFGIQFQIEDNLSLSDFQGKFLSAKYQITEKSGIRFGIGYIFDEKNVITDNSAFTSSSWSKKSNKDISDYHFQFNLQYLHNYKIKSNARLFVGFGPFFGYTSSNEYLSETGRDTTRTDRSVGIKVIIGVEYFLAKNLSLSGEYNPSFGYYSFISKVKQASSVDRRTETKGFQAKNENIKFGICVYL